MNSVRQQYIQFIAWPDTQPRAMPIVDREFSRVRMPDRHTYAFYFFELIECRIIFENEEILLTSHRRNESSIYYYGATVYTPDEYEEVKPCSNWKQILRHVKKEGWGSFMILRTGEPFQYNGEVIIPAIQ
jgi:hypothetical protein